MKEKTIQWSKVLRRARRDNQFRLALLENPRATLEAEYGLSLPKNVNFVIHEQTEETVHLVLPPLSTVSRSVYPLADDESVLASRYSDDDDDFVTKTVYVDDTEEVLATRIGDDEEEIGAKTVYVDDDEEILAKSIFVDDDEQEVLARTVFIDDDEEVLATRIGDDEEEIVLTVRTKQN